MTTLALAVGRAARTIDPAWAALGGTFTALMLADPAQALDSGRFLLTSVAKILPLLLVAVGLTAALRASGAENLVARAFKGRLAWMVVAAALMGALSPLCSCGVIPLIAALLGMGVPLAAVMAFWLASPLMDPSMFVMTAATLGSEFAMAKTVAAVGVGLLGGFGTGLLGRLGVFGDPLRGGGSGRTVTDQPVVWHFWREAPRRAAFAGSARRNLLLLGKWMSLAFLLESLMLAFVPADFVAGALGGEGAVPLLLAVAVGIPAYLNGYAALPLIAGLIEQGMAPGAGMAFLIAGGATSVPAAVAVFALVRPPVFVAYVGFAATGALAAGALFGWVA